MTIQVDIEWNWIEWDEGNTWKKNILPQLTECSISEEQLERCVYVIRSNGLFAINSDNLIPRVLAFVEHYM